MSPRKEEPSYMLTWYDDGDCHETFDNVDDVIARIKSLVAAGRTAVVWRRWSHTVDIDIKFGTLE